MKRKTEKETMWSNNFITVLWSEVLEQLNAYGGRLTFQGFF
jgi:hypothetical protein